ncbi:MAG TPA: type II toxin-antitoxin system ParD family antitoxin [Verrucomicrobiae bacterium]|jgi:antitoxin ParD1/3/4|nr:type II toxin-antitoxin system ParD family antitoxin [Verrucomicrobiae bacterium]
MTVTLTPEQEKFIAEQLKSGHYQSANDVIAQCLGMLRAQEEYIRTGVAELRDKLAVGIEQARRGELVDGKAAIQNLRSKLRRRRE